ncbi:hypothetical protein [Mycobacteroides immunogenum]|uniref:DUF1266 domain-containing protein n=1 Tax=Mycobacteroides immunogenum TaxID=83262 RepID=A0ABR5LKG6_9MYCO|nr:hypothetical protein [Mycobacteroides immunogenum]KPG26220.1 hypothetical protein AN912_25565 [Mycobacteroides immunogenum]KPG26294.1 hypothetical protein AN913_21250 [Mycobacteroides immunogenum]KPG31835.1 hypothetical protein AN914_26060 [Mycobacteroides immunogenum]KPG39688.1 hypothetical protein AN915_26490 [Mycobacteroides immunogenum]KPG57305.1 hypothetical protein AN918_26585 [Mycobacteroides immunogenum]
MSASPSTISWIDRLRAWIHERTRPIDELPPEQPWTDEQILARADLLAHDALERGEGELLDLRLKPYAAVRKDYLWERARSAVIASETAWITHYDDEHHGQEPRWSNIDAATMEPLSKDEADIRHAQRMAWWKEHQEVPLRPGDRAACISVWLWRNGLHQRAVDLFAGIWIAVREYQQEQKRIGWSPEAALDGFRRAAYLDWDDDAHADFSALFRQCYIDPEIDRGISELTEHP